MALNFYCEFKIYILLNPSSQNTILNGYVQILKYLWCGKSWSINIKFSYFKVKIDGFNIYLEKYCISTEAEIIVLADLKIQKKINIAESAYSGRSSIMFPK